MKDTLVVPDPPTLYVAIVFAPATCMSPACPVVWHAASSSIRTPVAPTGCAHEHDDGQDDEEDDSDDDAHGSAPVCRRDGGRGAGIQGDHNSKKRPEFHGKMKLKPGPRKKDPIMTSTAQNMRCTVISEMANLRSSGRFDGFLSM